VTRGLAALLALAAVGWSTATVGLGGAGGLAAAAGAGPAVSGTPAKSFNLAADDVSVSNDGTALVATGHVAVTYGSLRVTSDTLRIHRPTGTATFTGHVSAADERGRASAQAATLAVANESRVVRVALTGHASFETRSYAVLADRIVSDRQRNRLTAAGHVTVYSQPDLIVTGAQVTYDEGPQRAVVRGEGTVRATIQNRDGRLRGTWIEVSRATGVARVHGPVDAEIYDATLTGADATIDLERGTALITGDVTVSRRSGTLRADRLTVHYRTRQLVAEGTTSMSLIDLAEPSTP
jgi:lipopolysaccharide export system protein LptA